MNQPGVKRVWSLENALYLLLVFVPIALLLEHVVHAGPALVFGVSALGIIPLAGIMGRATEHLAARVGAGLGGLLNATFGNAAELIIALLALRAGLYDLVKASITGSIIGNILLVFGLSALLGGLKYRRQQFNATAARLGATMLLLAAIGLVTPAIAHAIADFDAPSDELNMSLLIAIVLMATYLLSLTFSLKTHAHLYVGKVAAESSAHSEVHWSASTAGIVLVLAAGATGLVSETLVASAEEAAHTFGMSEVFIGVVLVAIIGNAAEHSTAVLVALRDKMDLSINIAIGSSLQIALFVAPLLMFLSFVIGPAPMDLRFTTMEVVAIAASVGIIATIANDGETHWMEGVQLLAVYAILGIAFFFLPA